jgi:acyl carrier protein
MIVGGTGALGQLVAHHLVTAQGARRLLLLSRRGPDAPGAAAIAAELAGLGADVRLVAADAADPAAMAEVLAAIPAAHPLAAVVHCAGVVADATVTGLSPRGLDRVFRPKVDAALVLDELTPECDLVLFSSVSGLLGGAGQGNYAAANACLDALAHRRAAAGRRAVSLAWGLWDDGMADRLSSADLDRMARYGMGMMSIPEGLALFSSALGRGEPLLVPLRLNEKTLRSGSALPEMLTDLAPRMAADRSARSNDARAFRDALAALPAEEHEDVVIAFVRGQVATVLGMEGPENVDPDRELAELGFDSLTNLELGRNLSAATGLRLPATLSFGYPTVAELGRHLVRLLT